MKTDHGQSEKLFGDDSLLRFNLGLQKSRVAVYAIAYPLVLLFRPSDLHGISTLQATLVLMCAAGSAFVFHWAYRQRLESRWGIDLTPIWQLVDVALVTTIVYLDGGAKSLFFFWYVASMSSAAFARGMKAAVINGLVNLAAYVGVLVMMEHIVDIESLMTAVGKMAMLYGATAYGVIGIADLRRRRYDIKRLLTDEQDRLAELETLAAELREKNEEVRKADHLKSRFLANMSHELRTPMNSIIGFSEIVRQRLDSKIDERQLRFLDNVIRSGRHLLALINDLLDLSKIEAGHLDVHLASLEADEVAAEVIESSLSLAAKKCVKLSLERCEQSRQIRTDPAKLRQVLINLLGNAIKFSPEGSEVVVRLLVLPETESVLASAAQIIEVIDNGPGIDSSDHELIFDEFRQVHGDTHTGEGGTGLGLALVRKLLEVLGGAIEVDSELGAGATFRVSLPMTAECLEHPSPVFQHIPVDESGRPLVLVVEDDPNAAELIEEVLGEAGYATRRAARGDEALEMVREQIPAVITLDLILPGIDGWEVLRELKGHPQSARIPIVILSMASDNELGMALGADDCFVKPVDREALVERIKSLVEGRGQRLDTATILVIDDDPAVHELIAAHLDESGPQLLSAENGAAGFEMARQHRPDVVILDLMMPGMSGFEVAEAMAGDSMTRDLPIIILTAKDLSAEEREMLRSSVVSILRKEPPWPQQVLAEVRELLSRSGIRTPQA